MALYPSQSRRTVIICLPMHSLLYSKTHMDFYLKQTYLGMFRCKINSVIYITNTFALLNTFLVMVGDKEGIIKSSYKIHVLIHLLYASTIWVQLPIRMWKLFELCFILATAFLLYDYCMFDAPITCIGFWFKSWFCSVVYQLPIILIALMHFDLIYVVYLTACVFIRSSWRCTF